MNAWFVAHTAPRTEFAIVDALLKLGLDAYCPWETHVRRHARKSWVQEKVKIPLMSRYVFVELDADRPRTDLVEDIDGVEGMLRQAGGSLSRVTGQQLDLIRWKQICGLFDWTRDGYTVSAKRNAKREVTEQLCEVMWKAGTKPSQQAA
jgi:transcription antitermination factor NusG